jgi:DNA excision repair protein ERCC-4
MADTFLWDEDSLNPTGDVENPPVSIANDGQEANTDSGISKSTHATNFCSTSKAAKLGLGLLASAGVVAIGVVLGLNGSKDDPVPMQAASSASSIVKEADQGFVESNTKSINDSYITSPSSLEARVKMASSSSAKGFYDTCDDLEKDIIEALKLYMVDYIANEAVINEAYASCDPDNENWWWDLFWYDDDYYYHGSRKYRKYLALFLLATKQPLLTQTYSVQRMSITFVILLPTALIRASSRRRTYHGF